MNRLPSPFQNDLPKIMNTSTPAVNSPGFLMMTRPASASKVDLDSARRSFGRGAYRSRNYRARGHYSNNMNNSYTFGNQNNRGGPNVHQMSPSYGNQNRFASPIPNVNYSQLNSFLGAEQLQSTPNNFRGNKKNKSFGQKNPFHNKGAHNTPLKDVPIEKFTSRNMIQDPWNIVDAVDNIKTYIVPTINDESLVKEVQDEDASSVDEEEEGASTSESYSTIERTGSPLAYCLSSEKDSDPESDAINNV